MTLGPDEARAAVHEQEAAVRHREGVADHLLAIALGGLGLLPLYVGTVAVLHGAGRLWLVVAFALALALAGSSALASRRAREGSRVLGNAYTACVGLNMAVFAVIMGLAIWHHPAWSTAWLHACFLLLAPAVCSLLVAFSRTRA